MVVRRHHITVLESSSFENYVDSLGKRVASNPTLRCELGPETRRCVLNLVGEAESLGLDQECDVTMFVIVSLALSRDREMEPYAPWITGILRRTDVAARCRTDAIYALLPDDLRILYLNLDGFHSS